MAQRVYTIEELSGGKWRPIYRLQTRTELAKLEAERLSRTYDLPTRVVEGERVIAAFGAK